MGDRWYDAQLGRWISADTIVPSFANPQSLNRYSYVYNNPLKYIDPSGHDPIDEAWEKAFEEAHGRPPTDQDRRDRFFSILFPGSGENGAWTEEDWHEYSAHKDDYWSGARDWEGAMKPGLNRFIYHLTLLSQYYGPGEEMFYAQAIGFIWGGVPLGHEIPATWQMATNPGAAWAENTPLFEGTEGWNPAFIDDENPAHHYAGLFYLGYFNGRPLGYVGNWMRDGPVNFDPRRWGNEGIFANPAQADLDLGYLAVDHGAWLFTGKLNMGLDLSAEARAYLADPNIEHHGIIVVPCRVNCRVP